MKVKINKTIAIAIAVLVLSIGANFALAEKNNTPTGGYDHGCDDSKIKVFDDRYINQKGKGTAFHSSEFMSGYWAGMNACSDDDGTFVPNSNKHHYTSSYSYNTVSSKHSNNDDDDNTSCGSWSGGKNTCMVDGKVVVLNSPNHVDTLTQAQSQTQHVTCITIFSVCGNNNQQGQVASTSLED